VGAALLTVTTCGACALLLLRPAVPQRQAAVEAAVRQLDKDDRQLRSTDEELEAEGKKLDAERLPEGQQLEHERQQLQSSDKQLEPEEQQPAVNQPEAEGQQLELEVQQLPSYDKPEECDLQQLRKQLDTEGQQPQSSDQTLEAKAEQSSIFGDQQNEANVAQLEGKDLEAASKDVEAVETQEELAHPLVETAADGPLAAFRKSVRLLASKHMLLLSLTFLNSGIMLNLWSGLYGTCVGLTTG
jgi:hypothetical protein